jgi:hypothetical protein
MGKDPIDSFVKRLVKLRASGPICALHHLAAVYRILEWLGIGDLSTLDTLKRRVEITAYCDGYKLKAFDDQAPVTPLRPTKSRAFLLRAEKKPVM